MKVLSIGTDRKLFTEDSSVLERSKSYASKTEEYHVIVFTLKSEEHKFLKIGNLYIHPTNSLSQWFYVLDGYRLSKKIFKDFSFKRENAVVSTQDPFQTGFVGMCISERYKIPLQVQIHTDYLSPYFSESFFNIIRGFIASIVIPNADGIRVVSSIIADSLKTRFKRLKARVDILPVFVEIENFMNANSVDGEKADLFDFTVLMASRLTEEKRIDVALDAFTKVVEKFPKTGLLICGDGPEKEKLENLAKDHRLINNVVFMGWRNDLVSLYKTSDLFLLSSEYEGYGMTLIEAGASGCPIVTTNVGVAKTDLFKSGINSYICNVGDVEAISKDIIDLITNQEKRKLFKDKMQDSIRSIMLSKQDYVNKYITLLEGLIK